MLLVIAFPFHRPQSPLKTLTMGKRVVSDHVKCQKASHIKEKRVQEAVTAYALEQEKPENERKGTRQIAELYGIPNQYKTIGNRYNGMRSTREAHQDQQNLTAAEEEVLVRFLEESADCGFPQSISEIETMANLIWKGHLGPECKEVGESWCQQFLDRHRECLQTHWSKSLDTQRVRGMNPEAKKSWYELVKKYVVEMGIRPEDLYAMDETGCPPSDQGTRRVVGR